MVHGESSEERTGLIQRHTDRFITIERDVHQLELDMALLKTRVERTEEGVSNFREFQRKSLQHQWWMKGAAAAALAMLGGIGWTVQHFTNELIPAAKVLIEYYDRGHPDAQIPKISHSYTAQPDYPVTKPQQAGNEDRQP